MGIYGSEKMNEVEIRHLEYPVEIKYGISLIAVLGAKRDDEPIYTGEHIRIMFRHCCYCDNGQTPEGKEVYFTRKQWKEVTTDKIRFPYPMTSGIGRFCHDYAFKKAFSKHIEYLEDRL